MANQKVPSAHIVTSLNDTEEFLLGGTVNKQDLPFAKTEEDYPGDWVKAYPLKGGYSRVFQAGVYTIVRDASDEDFETALSGAKSAEDQKFIAALIRLRNS